VDVQSLVQAMLLDPVAPVTDRAAATTDRWCLIYRGPPPQELVLGTVPSDVGRQLRRSGRRYVPAGGLWRELNLTLVQG